MRDPRPTVLPDGDLGFAEFLAGKRIVVVGPARTLVGKRQGAFIDSFDVVVRLNDAFDHLPGSEDMARDIGTRADVFYCNQVILRKNLLQQRIASRTRAFRLFDQLDVKFIACTNNSLSFTPTGDSRPHCPPSDRRVFSELDELLEQSGASTRIRVVHAASRVLNQWLDGNWARTGFIALFDLLTFDVDQLHAMGMTFYHGGGHLWSPDAGELHPLKNRDGSWATSPAGQGHNSYLERDIMKWLVHCCPRTLTVDDELATLLGETGTSQPPHRVR